MSQSEIAVIMGAWVIIMIIVLALFGLTDKDDDE